MQGTVLNALYLLRASEVGIMIIPTLLMRKLRHRELKYLISQDLNPGRLAFESGSNMDLIAISVASLSHWPQSRKG